MRVAVGGLERERKRSMEVSSLCVFFYLYFCTGFLNDVGSEIGSGVES